MFMPFEFFFQNLFPNSLSLFISFTSNFLVSDSVYNYLFVKLLPSLLSCVKNNKLVLLIFVLPRP